MTKFPISPTEMAASFWRHRGLVAQLTLREVAGRYRGSVLGLVWSFFHPLLMLAAYTFVFSVVFQARWGGQGDSKFEFALVLFAGLMVYSLFAECLNRAPGLIVGNVNYVKKVVFPLEVLPFVALGSAMFHLLISLLVWIAAYLLMFGLPPLTALLFPLILSPLVFFTLGLSWMLASLGVYLRDVTQIVGVLTSVLMFVTPIFYPLDMLPADLRQWLALNPLAPLVAWVRDVLMWGKTPDWSSFAAFLLASLAVAWGGFMWFQKTRKGFADVL
jgi:lipopolysaccharide transport system permease protein